MYIYAGTPKRAAMVIIVIYVYYDMYFYYYIYLFLLLYLFMPKRAVMIIITLVYHIVLDHRYMLHTGVCEINVVMYASYLGRDCYDYCYYYYDYDYYC